MSYFYFPAMCILLAIRQLLDKRFLRKNDLFNDYIEFRYLRKVAY